MLDLFACFSKPALTAGIIGQRFEKGVASEIGPVQGRYKNFRISSLKKQKVAQSKFSGGSNDQVGVGKITGLQIRGKLFPGWNVRRRWMVLPIMGDCPQYFLPTAIIQGEGEIPAVVFLGVLDGVLDDAASKVGQTGKIANCP